MTKTLLTSLSKNVLSLLLCGLMTATISPAAAQGSADPAPAALLAKIQSDKKGLVERSMNLTPEEAKKFWPLYERFQRELAGPQREYARAVLDYVATEKSLTNANAKRLGEQVLAASSSEARLRERHFKDTLKVLPAVKAARYAQIENKIQAVQRFEAAKAIPLAE